MKARGDGRYFILEDDDGAVLTRVRLQSEEVVQNKLASLGEQNVARLHPWDELMEKPGYQDILNNNINFDDQFLIVDHLNSVAFSCNELLPAMVGWLNNRDNFLHWELCVQEAYDMSIEVFENGNTNSRRISLCPILD